MLKSLQKFLREFLRKTGFLPENITFKRKVFDRLFNECFPAGGRMEDYCTGYRITIDGKYIHIEGEYEICDRTDHG